ncbi:MAG: hypothetical protein PHF84_05205, partial [bacterium]|nr:hypothetical protein [bacterium]
MNISGIGSYNQNHPADTDNNYLEAAPVYIWIQEINNTTSATGLMDIDPYSRTGVSNALMTEAGSGRYYYVWNTTGLSNGSYSLESMLRKPGMTNDLNGYNNTGTDLVIRITNGLNISAISSEAGDDKDNNYNTGDKVKVLIAEKNYAAGCEARIVLYTAEKTNVRSGLMTGTGSGEYYYEWDTTGLSGGTYYVETTITNSSHPAHRPDLTGYNDSGADLVITLVEKESPQDQALVLWNNYPR